MYRHLFHRFSVEAEYGKMQALTSAYHPGNGFFKTLHILEEINVCKEMGLSF
jgi:hypothetical protein